MKKPGHCHLNCSDWPASPDCHPIMTAVSEKPNTPPGLVFHIDEHHAPSHMGITAVVSQISRYLAAHRWPTAILTTAAADTQAHPGVELISFPQAPWGRRWYYPLGMRPYLEGLAQSPGIFHIHGPWGAPQWLAARTCKKSPAVAGILTAHGVMLPWHWQHNWGSRLRYRTYWWAMAYPNFRHAKVIHAITPAERDHLAGLFPGQRLEVIPNAIDLTEADRAAGPGPIPLPEETAGRYLLFLGQLHPKKGIDLLIQSFHNVCKGSDLKLLLAGPDRSSTYSAQLKSMVERLGLSSQVRFTGAVYGPQKWQLYRQAWAFCLPSRSEVVGMVNLEAAAARTPVLTTYETGLTDWEASGGVMVHPDQQELDRALARVLSWSEAERDDRGRQLRQLIGRRYSMEVVGRQWLSLYAELLGNCR